MTLLSETDGYGWWHLGDAVPARATHAPHRANLRCLGLSVGIAIAFAGCTKPFDGNAWKADEIDASTYRNILWNARNGEAPECVRMLSRFMADGKITYGELHDLNGCDGDAANRAVPLAAVKRALAQDIGGPSQ